MKRKKRLDRLPNQQCHNNHLRYGDEAIHLITQIVLFGGAGLLAFGTLLDALSNALTIITPRVTFIGTIVSLILALAVLLLNLAPKAYTIPTTLMLLIRWNRKEWFALTGIVFLLWVPYWLPALTGGKSNALQTKLVMTPIEGATTYISKPRATKYFDQGVKYKLSLQNESSMTQEIESVYLVLVRYQAPEAITSRPKKIDKMKFGDVKVPNQAHLSVFPNALRGFWILSGETISRKIRESSTPRLNLIQMDQGADLSISVKPNDVEIISGTIIPREPGKYELLFEINYKMANDAPVKQVTESLNILQDSEVSSTYSESVDEKVPHTQSLDIGQKGQDKNTVLPKYSGLGPANLIKAFSALYLLSGEKVTVYVNDKYDLGEMSSQPISSSPLLLMMMVLEKVLQPEYRAIAIILVSDGNMNHALTPIKVTQSEGPMRLYFRDPWGDESFLENGKNIVDVSARREGDGLFSIDYGECEKVIVALGYAPLQKKIQPAIPRAFDIRPLSKK